MCKVTTLSLNKHFLFFQYRLQQVAVKDPFLKEGKPHQIREQVGYFCFVSSACGSWGMKLGDSKHIGRPGCTELGRLQLSAFHLDFLHLEMHVKGNERGEKKKKVKQELKCIQQLTYFDRFSVSLFPVQVKHVFFNSVMRHSYLKPLGLSPSPYEKGF